MKKTYIVGLTETSYKEVHVEANTGKEAREKVKTLLENNQIGLKHTDSLGIDINDAELVDEE